MLTTSSIQNIINTGIGHIGTLYRVYDAASKIVTAVEYAGLIVNLKSAFAQPGPAAILAALQAELLKNTKGVTLDGIANGVTELFNQIGPNWSEIASAIGKKAPQIAAEASAAALTHLPAYTKAEATGKLRLVFFSPTAPSGRSGGDTYIPLGSKMELGVNLGGGIDCSV